MGGLVGDAETITCCCNRRVAAPRRRRIILVLQETERAEQSRRSPSSHSGPFCADVEATPGRRTRKCWTCGAQPQRHSSRRSASGARNRHYRQASLSRPPSTWWRHEPLRRGSEIRRIAFHSASALPCSRNPPRKRTCAFWRPSLRRLRARVHAGPSDAAALRSVLSRRCIAAPRGGAHRCLA